MFIPVGRLSGRGAANDSSQGFENFLRDKHRPGRTAGASAYEHSLSVLCSSAQQFDCMRQQIGYGFKGLHRTSRAAREIKDQSLAAYTTHTAA